MSHRSTPELLVLHGVRVLGAPATTDIALRFGLASAEVAELLLDAQAFGQVSRNDYFGETWSLTERGKAEGERLLSAELIATGATDLVARVHREFLPLNARHSQACTDWQLHPNRADPRAANDHDDPLWDHQVLTELEQVDSEFAVLAGQLAEVLSRFEGYAEAHRTALRRARAGQLAWVDQPDRQSCQLVWIQFHEDLLATLGLERGTGN